MTEEENRNLPQVSAAEQTISEAIQNLLPELREIIYKEYLTIKMKQRLDMGWDEVHEELLDAPFCEERARIVKVIKCRKCSTCGRDGLCYVCFKNGVKHYIDPPWFGIGDYDEIFLKFW